MEVCINVPRAYWHLAEKHSDYYFLLAHQIVESDKSLFGGKYVTLDNGAFELGRSIPFKDFIEVIEWVDPDEIILPDACNNAIRTMKSTIDFLNYYPTSKLKMAVAQGRNWKSWLACYKRFLQMDQIDIIGIPMTQFQLYCPLLGKYLATKRWSIFTRVEILNVLSRMKLIQKPVHILGSIDPLELLYMDMADHYAFRTDSKVAFQQGIHGEKITTARGLETARVKEEMFFDFQGIISPRNMRIIYKNIKAFKKLANTQRRKT